MERALWVAKTGLDTQQMRMAVVAHNLANVSTTGFKRGRGVFADLLYQNVRQPGAQSSESSELPSGLLLGTGVHTVATEKLFTQGNIVHTENPLDLACCPMVPQLTRALVPFSLIRLGSWLPLRD